MRTQSFLVCALGIFIGGLLTLSFVNLHRASTMPEPAVSAADRGQLPVPPSSQVEKKDEGTGATPPASLADAVVKQADQQKPLDVSSRDVPPPVEGSVLPIPPPPPLAGSGLVPVKAELPGSPTLPTVQTAHLDAGTCLSPGSGGLTGVKETKGPESTGFDSPPPPPPPPVGGDTGFALARHQDLSPQPPPKAAPADPFATIEGGIRALQEIRVKREALEKAEADLGKALKKKSAEQERELLELGVRTPDEGQTEKQAQADKKFPGWEQWFVPADTQPVVEPKDSATAGPLFQNVEEGIKKFRDIQEQKRALEKLEKEGLRTLARKVEDQDRTLKELGVKRQSTPCH